MDLLKFFGFQSSPEYETIKNSLKLYTKELQSLGSKALSGEERKCLNDRYKHIVNLTENKNISVKEFRKLQGAIKKFRKQFEHLGFFDYVSNIMTVSTYTMTEYVGNLRSNNKKKDESQHKPQIFDEEDEGGYSDLYYSIVSQLANLIINIENSVSFNSSNIIVYKLRFETIKENINGNELTQREFEKLTDLYDDYLARFESYVENETGDKINENEETASKIKGQFSIESDKLSSEISFTKPDPLASCSNESKHETLIKITDLAPQNQNTQNESSINLQVNEESQTDIEHVDWKILENLKKAGYKFLSYNELFIPATESNIVQNAFSYQESSSETNTLQDSELPQVEQDPYFGYDALYGKKKSFFEILGFKRKSPSKETTPSSRKGSESKNSIQSAISAAEQKYHENVKTIHYKRLQSLRKSHSGEQDGPKCDSVVHTHEKVCTDEELEKRSLGKNVDVKSNIQSVSQDENEMFGTDQTADGRYTSQQVRNSNRMQSSQKQPLWNFNEDLDQIQQEKRNLTEEFLDCYDQSRHSKNYQERSLKKNYDFDQRQLEKRNSAKESESYYDQIEHHQKVENPLYDFDNRKKCQNDSSHSSNFNQTHYETSSFVKESQHYLDQHYQEVGRPLPNKAFDSYYDQNRHTRDPLHDQKYYQHFQKMKNLVHDFTYNLDQIRYQNRNFVKESQSYSDHSQTEYRQNGSLQKYNSLQTQHYYNQKVQNPIQNVASDFDENQDSYENVALFDLDSVDLLKTDSDKLNVLEEYATALTAKIYTFDKGKFSLEYFVLGKKLRRYKKKLEKIKCQKNQTAREKRRELTECIKRLQIVLNERAKKN